MANNVLIGIIAVSGVPISAIVVLGAAIFVYRASNKRLDKIERALKLLHSDMRQGLAGS